jgi:hydroxymethylpyrimidine/phosphomethylpyrimidine kinase
LVETGDVAELLALGCGAVLVTGGHGDDPATVTDVLAAAGTRTEFRHPRVRCGPVHGSGCALSSRVAAALASGADLESACRDAIDFVVRCLRRTRPSGDGRPVPIALTDGP